MSNGNNGSHPPPGHRGKRQPAKKLAYGDYFFVNIELSDRDRVEFAAWQEKEGIGIEALDYLISDGCKVSFSPDPNGGGIICSASQQKPDHPNAGAILTARAGNSATAIAVLIYKDQVLCAEGVWRQAEYERAQNVPEIG